ncbi:MAG: type II CAAX endopeptidase family protein [Terracidiphilus sp.]|jgi:membrane protease YdiL (CAAX protease family)
MSNPSIEKSETLPVPLSGQAIAPAWHTAVVLLLLLGVSAESMHMRAGHEFHRVTGYAIAMFSQWLIVAFICLGQRWGGASLRTLAGSCALGWRAILRDLGLAIAYLVAANIVLGVLGSLLARLGHPSQGEALQNLLPRTGLEIVVFLLLALTAGICEETIFRGYLQRQFKAWSRNGAVGIVAQGVVFGVCHAYQGSTMIIIISVYGVLFGLLAAWRKSLRPGMIAHFLQDGVGGLLLAARVLR